MNGIVGNLRDIAGRYWIRLYCENPECGHTSKIDPADLLERHGDLALHSVSLRARCVKCGGRRVSLQLAPGNRPDGSDAPRKI